MVVDFWNMRFLSYSVLLVLLFVLQLSKPEGLSNKEPAGPNNTNPRPIILVPGILGSQLFVKLDGLKRAKNLWCFNETKNFYRVWISATEFLPEVVNCMLNDIKLFYDPSTRVSLNHPGVEVKVPGSFGDTTAIEYLGSKLLPKTHYFHQFISSASSQGYKHNDTIFGAAYDWRKAPNEQHKFFMNLEELIENTTKKAGKRPVVLCHSMGCLFALFFLNKQSDEWKRQNVRSLVTVGGPWGGAVGAIKAFSIGHNFGIKVYHGTVFRDLERTLPSIGFLMPNKYIWSQGVSFVETPNKQYDVTKYQELFGDFGDPQFYEIWKDTSSLITDLKHPGVDVFCIYGNNRSTVEKLVYSDMEKFPHKPQLLYGNGDGTVNSISLKACHSWAQSKIHHFRYHVHEHGDHVKMIENEKLAQLVLDYVSKL